MGCGGVCAGCIQVERRRSILGKCEGDCGVYLHRLSEGRLGGQKKENASLGYKTFKSKIPRDLTSSQLCGGSRSESIVKIA